MITSDVERAEGLSRARALLMAIAAAVMIVNIVIQYGDPAYVSANVRGGSWLVVIGLWVFMLWNGGGLRRRDRACDLLNDELSLRNRSRALAFGFYATIGAALVLYVVGWSVPIAAGDSLKIVSGGGVAAALACYAWLEWH